jgi:hypothetical protein
MISQAFAAIFSGLSYIINSEMWGPRWTFAAGEELRNSKKAQSLQPGDQVVIFD